MMTYNEKIAAYEAKTSDLKEIFDLFGWEKAKSRYKDLKFSFSVRYRGRRVVFRIFNDLGNPCVRPDPWSMYSLEECEKEFVMFLKGGCFAYTTLDEKHSVCNLPAPDETASWDIPHFETVEELRMKMMVNGNGTAIPGVRRFR